MPILDIPQKIWEDLKEEFAQLYYPYSEEKLVKELESYIIKEEEREYLLLFKDRMNTVWFPLESYTNLKDATDAYDKVINNNHTFLQYKIIMNARFSIIDEEE